MQLKQTWNNTTVLSSSSNFRCARTGKYNVSLVVALKFSLDFNANKRTNQASVQLPFASITAYSTLTWQHRYLAILVNFSEWRSGWLAATQVLHHDWGPLHERWRGIATKTKLLHVFNLKHRHFWSHTIQFLPSPQIPKWMISVFLHLSSRNNATIMSVD